MPTVADSFDVVIGVDTHADTHSYVVCTPCGGVISQTTLPTTPAGLTDALSLAGEHAGPSPARVAFAVEGTRSYGIGVTRAAQLAGHVVIEVEQPERKHRRGRGKSDPIDARLAARQALAYDIDKLPTPRCDGPRSALQILLTARRDMTDERTKKVNRVKALLRTGSAQQHSLASAAAMPGWLDRIIRRRGRQDETADAAQRRMETRRLAARIRELDRELNQNKTQLADLVKQLVPGLLTQPGIGPVSAAQAIVSFSHHGRCRNEAAYAALAGASPLPASSGKTTRHRLNRGGDRALNRALHDITRTRMRCCEHTRTYLTRRRADGKTDAEIRRSLKRYIARDLYRQLTKAPALAIDNT